MHDVCSFSHCQRFVEQTAFHCSAQALQCHDVLRTCWGTRLLPTEPPTQNQARRMPKDQLPRRVLVRVRTDVSVRSEEPYRAGSKSSVAFAPPLCYWDAGNNCGQMVPDAGQVRASTRFSADASGPSSATGRSTGPRISGCRRRPCSTCLTCFRLFWSNFQMSFVLQHTQA